MKKVYIFSSPNCKACKNLKEILNIESVSHIEINIDIPQNEELWNDIVHQTNSIALPLLVIQDENTENCVAYLHNEDWKTHEELIEIIKKNI